MILPIGHEASAVRRLPWVIFSLIAACVVSFLRTDTEALYAIPDRHALLSEAADYWRQHAYLEAEPEVRTAVSYDVMPNQRSQYLQLLESQGRDVVPDDPEQLAAEQAELDLRTDLALGRASPEAVESPENPYRRWGLVPGDLRPATLLTHLFMHAGWLHLLSNLFMLFLAGPALEDRLGRPLFAAFYLAAGIFAGLFHAALTPDKLVPLVGASGAIAGVLGAFCIRFWSSNIKFLYFFMLGFRVFHGTFEAPAWLMLPLWFANELFQAWLMQNLGLSSGVAYWAHVGGFAFGAGVMVLIAALRIEQKYIHSAIEQKVTLAQANPALEEALDAREQGDPERALSLLQDAWQRDRDDRDLALALWDTALACERPEAGVAAMKVVIRRCAGQGEMQQALAHWMELTRRLPTALVDPGSLLRMAAQLLQEGDSELAIRALRHGVDPGNAELSVGLALRAADMAGELDPPTALRAARRALDFPDLNETKRARIEALVRELEAGGVCEAPDVFGEAAALERARAEARKPIEVPDLEASLPAGGAAVAAAAARAAPLQPAPAPRTGGPSRAVAPPRLELTAEGTLAAAPQVAASEPPPLSVPVAPPPLPPSPALSEAERLETASQDELAPGVQEAVEDVPRFAALKLVEACPTSLEEGGLRLRVSEGRKARIEYAKIDAVAVAVVRDLGPKPVLVIDLLLNWSQLEEAPLRVIRLQSTGFDPRALGVGVEDPTEAFRSFIGRILEGAGAIALPDAAAARGRPFRVFEDLASYQREVLRLDC